jgi:alkanesulfonate monooxygenase
MAPHFQWFLPGNGDGRDIVDGGHGVATGSAGAIRPASLGYLGYLGQVARGTEQLGFEAALTSTGVWCEDAWLVTGILTEVNAAELKLILVRSRLAAGRGVHRKRASVPLASPAPGHTA